MNPRDHPGWPAFEKMSGDAPDLTGIAGLAWSYFAIGWDAKGEHDSPDPHAAEQAVAVAENDAGPNGTPKLSLAEEAAILRELVDGCRQVGYFVPVEWATALSALGNMLGHLDRLQASNAACQVTAQQDCVEPGDLPQTGIDKYEREKDAVEQGSE